MQIVIAGNVKFPLLSSPCVKATLLEMGFDMNFCVASNPQNMKMTHKIKIPTNFKSLKARFETACLNFIFVNGAFLGTTQDNQSNVPYVPPLFCNLL